MGTKRCPQNPKRMQSPQIQCKTTAKNWQRACGQLVRTNDHFETLCDILLFSKPRQLQQTANYKIRGRRCSPRRMTYQDINIYLFIIFIHSEPRRRNSYWKAFDKGDTTRGKCGRCGWCGWVRVGVGVGGAVVRGGRWSENGQQSAAYNVE